MKAKIKISKSIAKAIIEIDEIIERKSPVSYGNPNEKAFEKQWNRIFKGKNLSAQQKWALLIAIEEIAMESYKKLY